MGLGITAAVVGVILSMGVRFTGQAVWPDGTSTDWFILVVVVISWLVLAFTRTSLFAVIAGCGLTGFLQWWFMSA
jgi:chromate transport protein ChrA